MIHIIESSIRIRTHSTAHAPRELGDGLNVEVHIAIEEEHGPHERGKARIRRRRPIVGRPHVTEGMAIGETNRACPSRARGRGGIHQAR